MRRSLPLILVSAAVVIAVSILAWQTWLTFAPTPSKSTTRPTARSNDASSPTAPPKVVKRDPTGKIIKPGHDPNPDRLRSLDNPEPVKVKLSGVMRFKGPLHANAPGRMPVKEGERELGGDTLPAAPLLYARSLPRIDPGLESWLREWDAAIRREGEPPSPGSLTATLASPSLTLTQLYHLARGIEFVSGPGETSTLFYAAALDRAQALASTSGPTVFENEQADALRRMTRPLWERPVRDLKRSALLLSLLAEVEPDGTFARYRARMLYGEAYYEMGRTDPEMLAVAANVYETVIANPGIELSPLIVAENHWLLSCVYGQARQYEKSIPHRIIAAQETGQYYTIAARVKLIKNLASTGQTDLAIEAWHKYKLSLPPSSYSSIESFLGPLPSPPTSENLP